MKLERRVLGYLAVVMTILSLLLAAAAAGAILVNANRTDRAETLRSVQLVHDTLAASRAELAGNAKDWATRDDTHRLVAGEYPEYFADNLSANGMRNLDINLFAVYDGTGRLVQAKTADSASRQPIDLPGVEDLLFSSPRMNVASGVVRSVSGLVRLPNGRLLLASAAPVVPTDGATSTPNGTLVMGKLLDSERLRGLSRNVQHTVRLRSMPGPSKTTAAEQAQVRPGWFSSSDGIASLTDTNGDVVGEMVVRADGSAWNGAVLALTLLSCGLVLLQLTTVYILRYGLRGLLLDRVFMLNAQVERIRQSGSVEHVMVPGSDELSTLGENVDQMVQALDESRRELQRAHDELEVRVEERTADLSQAIAELEEQIAGRRAAEDGRAASDERYRLLIDNLTDTVFTLDRDGCITYVSPGVEWAFGYLTEDLVGKSIAALLTLPSASTVARQLERGLSKDGTVLGLDAVAADGRELDVEMVLTPLDVELGSAQGIIRDVTARRRYEDELLHMASHDFLTGLANRRRFEEELGRVLATAQRHDTEGAVLWIDLDNFKDVNDTLGHHAGDDLLMDIARTLRSAVRAESLLSRLGGDEFAVLLPLATREEAQGAADRLLDEISNVHVFFEGRVIRASGSMGIVMFPSDGLDVGELLARADMAMYRAKQLGRARSVFFTRDDEWHDEIEDRRAWTEQIELAVSENGLAAFAQPIVGLGDGLTGCFELLVRMLDIDGGYIPPDRFIGIAERTGLIVDIDLWMLREAVRLLVEFDDQCISLNVNVSARTLGDSRFVAEVARLIEESGVSAERLGIEITETAIIVDVASVQDVLRELKRIGCRVLLDDFGSGFTSFLHLKQLPVDTLKIDGSFVQRLHENPNDQHLVRAMVEMARGLGMGTTAEFVETGEAAELLREFGVETIQGFHVGRPGVAREIIQGELAHSDAREILLTDVMDQAGSVCDLPVTDPESS